MRSLLSKNIHNIPSLEIKQQVSDIKQQVFEMKPSSQQGFVDEDAVRTLQTTSPVCQLQNKVHQNKWFWCKKKHIKKSF